MRLEDFVKKLISLGYEVTPLPPYSIARGSKKFRIQIEKVISEKEIVYLPLSFYKIDYKFTENLLEAHGRTLHLPQNWWKD
ncbi:hypothetical protein EHQ76_06810 [Leptospira barantonii]|uniref:Uncharacterized protein n=1 Tax=Leptospira barantonii TaxID=2023184 RepID=A0A5F2BK77_9LEPT|nr:hypothetical protein EHQ76_06810 [Leptospira barantonii]